MSAEAMDKDAREIHYQLRCDVAAHWDDEPTVELPRELVRAVLLEHFMEYCAAWPDQSHPALSGQTPRQVAALANGRERVEGLIADLEQQARGTPVAEACDFERLRLELGLASTGSGRDSERVHVRYWAK